MENRLSITKEITQNLTNKFNNIFLDGLALKGFIFEDIKEAESFVKQNCRCEDKIDLQEKIYFVNGIPFLYYNYKTFYDPIIEYNNEIKMSANCGYYKFL